MNLVAKEFVAARDDEDGVLILSQFAGASRELKDALIVNPYDIEEMADAIRRLPEDGARGKIRQDEADARDHKGTQHLPMGGEPRRGTRSASAAPRVGHSGERRTTCVAPHPPAPAGASENAATRG